MFTEVKDFYFYFFHFWQHAILATLNEPPTKNKKYWALKKIKYIGELVENDGILRMGEKKKGRKMRILW